jgi:plasmid maintenance system killer protein
MVFLLKAHSTDLLLGIFFWHIVLQLLFHLNNSHKNFIAAFKNKIVNLYIIMTCRQKNTLTQSKESNLFEQKENMHCHSISCNRGLEFPFQYENAYELRKLRHFQQKRLLFYND